MELLKIKNEENLEMVIETMRPENCEGIMGGMQETPNWDEYLQIYDSKYLPYFQLIKKGIESLGWVGETADRKASDTFFVFSDGMAISFSWRAWGDLMSAIVGKNEGYMAYYM